MSKRTILDMPDNTEVWYVVVSMPLIDSSVWLLIDVDLYNFLQLLSITRCVIVSCNK